VLLCACYCLHGLLDAHRVKRGKKPGQFYLSVLDNGVISSEYWRILDAADDLSWATFYYGGAASAAGTSYTGYVVVRVACHVLCVVSVASVVCVMAVSSKS
jgi:hypothetical protein